MRTNELIEMVPVEGGTFRMGTNDSNAYKHERPAHKVTVSKFLIGKTQITQALWKEVMGNNPSRFKGDNLPVEGINWEDCQDFIKKLNELTGMEYRLPTEAEWEYAARGGQLSHGYKYPGGNRIGDAAWHRGNSNKSTHPVGMKKPNELGLYDMAGNVWEWCSDWCKGYGSSSQENPNGSEDGQYRVLRGGNYHNYADRCHVYSRRLYPPKYRYGFSGLRLAMSV